MSRKSKAAEFLQQGYDITVTGRNVQVTDSMKDYAMEKISKIDKFSNRIIDVSVTMKIQKLDHRVDIIIDVDHIKIKSHASTTQMYASIDMAVDKIQRQLTRYKSRIQEHQAKSVATIDMNVNILQAPKEEELVNDEIEDETQKKIIDQYRPHEIVQRKTIPLKMLNQGEAVMKMDLSGDSFLIFRAEENRKIKVIYRRNDGNYGIIETE